MRAPRRTGPGEASQGEDLVPHQVQADDVWTVTLIEVRAHSVPYGEAQFLHGLRLCMDCVAERVGDIPTLRSLLNEEDNLNVVRGACHRTGSYHDWPPLSMIACPDEFCSFPDAPESRDPLITRPRDSHCAARQSGIRGKCRRWASSVEP